MPWLIITAVTGAGALLAGYIGNQWRDDRYEEYKQTGVIRVTKSENTVPWLIAAGSLYIAYKK